MVTSVTSVRLKMPTVSNARNFRRGTVLSARNRFISKKSKTSAWHVRLLIKIVWNVKGRQTVRDVWTDFICCLRSRTMNRQESVPSAVKGVPLAGTIQSTVLVVSRGTS
jgi:hypothetical protein